MQQPILETINLSSGYGRIIIVTGASIHVQRGEIVTIVGPNGSGKSTLIKSIMGIVKKFDGNVYYQGEDITNISTYRLIAKGIGYVPQIDNIFTNLTIQENLEMGAYTIKDNEAIKSRMEEVFEMFPELKLYRKRKANTLSGGERQMLAIAKAMMTKPKLLILDEPTANLAPKAISIMHKKITDIRERGASVLMSEQNAKKAMEITNRIYALVSGRCVYEGQVNETLDDAKLGKLFFRKKTATSNLMSQC